MVLRREAHFVNYDLRIAINHIKSSSISAFGVENSHHSM